MYVYWVHHASNLQFGLAVSLCFGILLSSEGILREGAQCALASLVVIENNLDLEKSV